VNLPIPPAKKVVDLFPFIWIFENGEDAVVESFGIGNEIGTRERARGTQRKANLGHFFCQSFTYARELGDLPV
jgi:hypothetical protein